MTPNNTTAASNTDSHIPNANSRDEPVRTLIAIPCMNMVHTEFMTSLVGLQRIGDTKSAVTVSSMIYDARDNLASIAIENGFDRILWLDSDMTFKPDLMLRLSEDMDQHALDYVCALYVTRANPIKPVIFKTISYDQSDSGITVKADNYYDYPDNALFPIAGSGFGAVLMKTDIVKKVWENFGLPFSPIMGFGEDISFCYRLTKLGINMYCDSRIKVGHIGQYEYNESDYLRCASDRLAGNNQNGNTANRLVGNEQNGNVTNKLAGRVQNRNVTNRLTGNSQNDDATNQLSEKDVI